MNKDVFERKNAHLHEQLDRLKKAVNQSGAAVGLSPAEITLANQLCDEYRQQITTVSRKRMELQSEAARKREMRLTHLKPLRSILQRMKNPPVGLPKASLPDFKSKLAKPDSATYKPKLKAEIDTGTISLRFKKLGADRLEFWGSCNDAPFKQIGHRQQSPFKYKPEPLPGNALQKWQIKAVGVVKDTLIGQWSDIVTVYFAASDVV